MTLGFENTLAFSAFAALIPLIIIYLIKPRPIKQAIPSLMFFIKKSRLSKKDNFFRHFQRDILFLLQLLTLLLLAFAATQPYFSHQKEISSANTVYVLDVSASSQVLENQQIRLDIAKKKLLELAGEQTTLVLAKATPLVALQHADNSELKRYLTRLTATDEESSIGEAILLAGELLKDKKGRVIVLSDFINTKSMNPETAKNVLLSKNIAVDFISTSTGQRKNIGIIKLVPAEDAITIYIKNYNSQEEKVTLKANGQEQTLTLKAQSIDTALLTPQEELTEIILDNKDDFPLDNKIFVSKPTLKGLRILLITNNKSKFVEAAVKSLDGVNLAIAEPPIIPKENYDIYIIHNINKDLLLSGTFEELAQKVEQGASLIIHAQKDSDKIDYKGLLPVKILNISSSSGTITIDQVNKFTKDIDFGTAGQHFIVDKEHSLTLASIEKDPLLSIQERGKGIIVYYGLLEKGNSFQLSPSYPLFWTKLLKFLSSTPELEDINLKTGTSIQATDGTFIQLEHTGVLHVGKQTIAVNLLNEEESDINPQEITGKKAEGYTLQTVKEEVKSKLFLLILFLATLFIILELSYTKTRGEI